MIDTNIFLDVLAESPFYANSKAVLELCESKKVYGFIQKAPDFEDCLLAVCAESNHCDAIVTRNKKGFLLFGITLLTPEELLEMY